LRLAADITVCKAVKAFWKSFKNGYPKCFFLWSPGLGSLAEREHSGRASRRMFVNTHDIQRVTEEGVKLFKTYVTPNRMPKEGLYFNGENGFRIGPDGSRVLLYRKTPKEKRSSKNRAAPGFKCISGNQGIQPGKRVRSFVRNSNCVFQPIN
jgi:hypothetical protein